MLVGSIEVVLQGCLRGVDVIKIGVQAAATKWPGSLGLKYQASWHSGWRPAATTPEPRSPKNMDIVPRFASPPLLHTSQQWMHQVVAVRDRAQTAKRAHPLIHVCKLSRRSLPSF
jgi:hypothetical protein